MDLISLLASFEKEPSFFDGVVGMIDANLDAVKGAKVVGLILLLYNIIIFNLNEIWVFRKAEEIFLNLVQTMPSV